MKNKRFLSDKTREVIRRIRPRTIVTCVLIAVLLVSTSIGFSYAKYTFQSQPNHVSYQIKNYSLTSSTYVLQTLTAAGNYRFDAPDGAVTVYYPKNAADAAYPNMEKFVAFFQPGNTTIDYTSNSCQIQLLYEVGLSGVDHTHPLDLIGVSDSSKPLIVDFNLSGDADYTKFLYTADNVSPSTLTAQASATYRIFRLRGISQLYLNDEGTIHNSHFEVQYNKKNWLAYADVSWYDDAESEFTLSSAAELAGLAKLVNNGTADFERKTIHLSGDISLADDDGYLRRWTPIGTQAHPFKGSFDGASHTLSGLNIPDFGASGTYATAGLFGYISGDAATTAIKDLTIDTAYIATELYEDPNADTRMSAGAAGTLAGWVDGGYQIENIAIVKSNLCGIATCGGFLLGRCDGATTFTNCTADADCTAEAGGFSAVNVVDGLVGYQSAP